MTASGYLEVVNDPAKWTIVTAPRLLMKRNLNKMLLYITWPLDLYIVFFVGMPKQDT